MAVTALIKFTQGPNTDLAGRAVKGTLADGAVTVTNGDNTDVARWKIELLYNPPGSALGAVPGTSVILAQAVSPTPSANFTPDVGDGCYRIKLTVWDSAGAYDVDIRNFGIPTGRGVIIPPYQKLPDPLPLLGSGEAGEKPDELNFDGQVLGWLGDADVGMHHDFFRKYDDLPFESVTSTPFTAAVIGEKPCYVVNLTTIGSDAVFNLPPSGWRIGQRFRVAAFGSAAYKLTVYPPAGHTINGLSSIVMKVPNSAVFVYLGGTDWLMLGAKYDVYERSIVAGEESVSVTGFESIGASALIDPSNFPNSNGQATWTAVIETSDILDSAEIRLFNVTLGAPVAGSTLSAASLTPTVVTSTVTLASGPNLYEAQLRLATTGAPNQATCRQAQLAINWFQP
jgi:hypothetical protein